MATLRAALAVHEAAARGAAVTVKG
jgi:hypothetical protein